MTRPVQPTTSALDIYEITSSIITDLIPLGSTFKSGFDLLIRKRLEEGQKILLDEIEFKGLNVLSTEQWDYFIPVAYRFFEQVRLGEYKHNLKVVAGLISIDLKPPTSQHDIGAISRAARKLEMLPLEHLEALSLCERAFRIYSESKECDGYWICIDNIELQAAYREVGKQSEAAQCSARLHELASRGILTTGGRPSRVGGHYYYRNQFYEEIMRAARDSS